MPSERTSRRNGASFKSPDCASSSASRCDQLSGFHKRAIVFRLCTTANKDHFIVLVEFPAPLLPLAGLPRAFKLVAVQPFHGLRLGAGQPAQHKSKPRQLGIAAKIPVRSIFI